MKTTFFVIDFFFYHIMKTRNSFIFAFFSMKTTLSLILNLGSKNRRRKISAKKRSLLTQVFVPPPNKL